MPKRLEKFVISLKRNHRRSFEGGLGKDIVLPSNYHRWQPSAMFGCVAEYDAESVLASIICELDSISHEHPLGDLRERH